MHTVIPVKVDEERICVCGSKTCGQPLRERTILFKPILGGTMFQLCGSAELFIAAFGPIAMWTLRTTQSTHGAQKCSDFSLMGLVT